MSLQPYFSNIWIVHKIRLYVALTSPNSADNRESTIVVGAIVMAELENVAVAVVLEVACTYCLLVN